tara:strand:- start:285 stop:980 length:696 start_codon:yes stop_codon:yes gene_type:complete
MEPKRLTGPGAGSLKYDVLTALCVSGLHGSSAQQVSMTRLCCLITARYNWKLDHFCVGQPEMARMWHVTERTVKREIKRWCDDRLLICVRKGVRGRVGAYRLNIPEVFEKSRDVWISVGTDYAERMDEMDPARATSVVKVDFAKVVPDATSVDDGTSWFAVSERLKSLYPEKHRNWFAPLRFVSDEGGKYTLAARSGFVVRYLETHFSTVMAEAVRAEVGHGRRIVFIVEG